MRVLWDCTFPDFSGNNVARAIRFLHTESGCPFFVCSKNQIKIMKDIIEISNIRLTESIKPNSKYKCVIIKAGLTSTANAYSELDGKKIPIYKNYTEEALQKAVNAGLFENVPALYRSDEEHLQGKNTGVNQVVGTFTDVSWNDENKQVEGIFNLKHGGEYAERFKQKLAGAWQSVKDIGLSISGIGKYVIEKLKDKYVAVVTEIDSLQSIDPVPAGNAGGKLIALIESTYGKNNIKNLNEVKMNQELKQKIFELLTSAMQLDSEPADGSINNVVAEAKKLLCEAQLQNALAKSRLPEIVKDKIKKQFTGKVFESKDLEDAMKLEQKILAELNPAIIDNGGAGRYLLRDFSSEKN